MVFSAVWSHCTLAPSGGDAFAGRSDHQRPTPTHPAPDPTPIGSTDEFHSCVRTAFAQTGPLRFNLLMNRRNFLQKGALTTAGITALGATAASAAPLLRRTDGATTSDPTADARADLLSINSAGGDLTPYIPTAEKPWNIRRAGHLLRRIGFGATWSDLQNALASTPSQIVQQYLTPPATPDPPGPWATQQPFASLDNDAVRQYAEWTIDLQRWWAAQMLDPARRLQEKMTLFWHNHFVSEQRKVYVTQYMYMQNQLFRDHAFGDVRELAHRVTVDPAMLIYLDGAYNNQVSPNENYGRELMELFTLGVGAYADGTPHYTEHDIIEMSRALTGWTVSGLGSQFTPARFDNGMKTIFGKTANFGVGTTTADDVIDFIFEQMDTDYSLPRTAIFICQKLYRWFVHDVPNMDIVAQMAQVLVDNQWQVGPVLQALFTSEHFFDDQLIGAMLRSPADFVLGSLRGLSLTPVLVGTSTSINYPERHDPTTAMAQLSENLFYHPSVQGWVGGRTWISSTTAPLRIRYAKYWVEPIASSLAYDFDPHGFITALPDNTSASKLLDHMIELLLPIDVSSATRDLLLVDLLGGGPAYEWDPEAPTAVSRVRACLIRMTGLGEFQLM